MFRHYLLSGWVSVLLCYFRSFTHKRSALRHAFMISVMLLLFASLVSAERITLAWDDPNNNTTVNRVYRLYYWQPAWLSPESIDVGMQTTYKLSGLEARQTYTFAVTVHDGQGGRESVRSNQVSKTFAAPVNNEPVAMADQITTLEDKAVTINVLSNDTDANGDTLTISALGAPASGTVTTNGTSITYTPKANFAGNDTFSYTVKDTHGATGRATVTVTVTAVNDTPVAMADQATTSKATAVTINVLGNDTDADGNTHTVSALDFPASGTATTNGTSITYTPSPFNMSSHD